MNYIWILLNPVTLWILVLWMGTKSNFLTHDDSKGFLARFGAVPYLIWAFNPVWVFLLFIAYGWIQALIGDGVPSYIRVPMICFTALLLSMPLVKKGYRHFVWGSIMLGFPLFLVILVLITPQ